MLLDSLDGDEERLGDLLVAHLLGRHLRDPPLARRQRVQATEQDRARVRPGRRELLVPPCDQGGGAAPMRDVDPLAQKFPRLAATVAAPQQRPKVDERPRVLEPGWRIREHLDRLTQQHLACLSTLEQAEGAQRDADRARGAPSLRELELLVCQITPLLRSAEAVEGECGLRPPRRERGILDAQGARTVSGGTEVRQRLLRRTGVERDKPADARRS